MNTEVIVVGAGPTGLMLAGELRLGGADVVVVETLAEPTGQSRGLGFTARAMETLDQRGLLPGFGTVETSPMGHFGGVQFDYTVLDGCHFGARGIPQSVTERVLEDWAGALGADIRRGWRVTELADTESGVKLTVQTPDGPRQLWGQYVVGCDGAQSTVRELAGIEFPGTPPTRRMYLADIIDHPVRPRPLGERLPSGMVMAAPLGPGVDRIIVCEQGTPPGDRTHTTTFAEVADAWQRITGESLHDGGAEWVSSFTDATRQAVDYRRGRVLLAGDAAHIHLPAGGQGLSTGIQDAANLGWKLAATVAGWAPPDLLDTYHAERHPVGARLLANTRVQGLVYLGGAECDPLRELMAELVESDDTKRYLAGLVSGLDIRYDFGPGEHPLLGRRIPRCRIETPSGTTTTTELLHGGSGLMLELACSVQLRCAVAGWRDRVTVCAATPEDPEIFAGAAAVLVRPDGYVAWAGTSADAAVAAMGRWFGSPMWAEVAR